MALSASSVWEVRTDGNDSNGGAFVPGGSGTDRSQQAAAHVAFDGSTITATTGGTSATITITGYTVVAGDVDNVLNVTGGTNFTTGRYHITSVNTGANTWTLDRNVSSGAGSGMTGNMGGALLSPAVATGAYVAGNKIWVKSGTYAMSTSSNVAAGRCTFSTITCFMRGYQTTRGDATGTRPIFQPSTTGVTLVTISNSGILLENLTLDGNSTGTSTGINFSSGSGTIRLSKIMGTTTTGIALGGAANTAIDCEITGCSGTAASSAGGKYLFCTSHDNTTNGFTSSVGSLYYNCISHSNTGGTTDGFVGQNLSSGYCYVNCLSYSNGRDGFNMVGPGACTFINCIADSNTRNGITTSGNLTLSILNCAFRNNTSAAIDSAVPNIVSQVNLSGDPFADAANDDFALDNTSGEGAACRGAGYPSTDLMGTITNTFNDIGPSQAENVGTTNITISSTNSVFTSARAAVGY